MTESPITHRASWSAPAASDPVHAQVQVPGSKSLTARYLVLAAIAGLGRSSASDSPSASVLHHPLVSRDSELMLAALAQLGVTVDRGQDDAQWSLTAPDRFRGGVDIECGLAGTVMRFVPPLAALADGPVRFDGDPAARTRPLGPVLGALRDLGVRVDAAPGNVLPATIHGTGRHPLSGGVVEVDASDSSQFVSALLLAAPAFDGGLTLRHVGAVLPSRPHIDMTVEVVRAAGVQVTETGSGPLTTWQVAPTPITPFDVVIEPDLSSAAPFLAAATVTGGVIEVTHWPTRTTQAGDHLPAILARLGATFRLIERDGTTSLQLTGPPGGRYPGLAVDLSQAGELTPVVAAVLALATGPSTITGVAHLRGHETDRLAALETELTRVGCSVEQLRDGLRIVPGPLRPARWQTYADHRIAMAGAVLALAVPGIEIMDPATTGKTFPDFAQVWERAILGGSTPDPAAPTAEGQPQHQTPRQPR